MSRKALAIVIPLVLLTGVAIGWGAGLDATPTATRFALGASDEVRGAKDRTLGLSRVIVPAGAELALHHHQGTQVAYIEKGTLTYTVEKGAVEVRRGAADSDPELVRTIKSGDTAKIKAGEWLVEQPTDHHSAANRTDKKIEIYLSTLLETGAPPSAPG